MPANLAPIALFTYKRPEHTLKTLEALSSNIYASDSELFVFCDGAKTLEDEELVRNVRDVVRSQQWCGKVHIIERATNWGLANSIINGVTDLCQKFGRVIVIEDDIVTSPYFLEYMNHALDLYAESPQVMQISGHMFPVNLKTIDTSAFFLPFTTSWGWATWDRAWKYFDPSANSYKDLQKNKYLQYKFDLKGSYPYFSMLENQLNGKINSWAIRWYLSMFMKDGVVLYPALSLINNIGFDGSGTHCDNKTIDVKISNKSVEYFPSQIQVDKQLFDIVRLYLKRSNRNGFFDRFRKKIFFYFNKVLT